MWHYIKSDFFFGRNKLTSSTARTEKVKACIYLPCVSSDNSRLHSGVSQVGWISLLKQITCLFSIEAGGKNSPGALAALYMRDIFRKLHERVRDLFEDHRFSGNIWPLNAWHSLPCNVSLCFLHLCCRKRSFWESRNIKLIGTQLYVLITINYK